MTRLGTWKTAVACTLFAICTSTARGQDQTGADTTLAGRPVVPICDGETIDRIDVHTYPPFDGGGTKFLSRLVAFATGFHSTTRPEVVRRFIPIRVGDTCSAIRVGEAERILRAQPFLADATVIVVPDGGGGVNLDVVTVDEVSLVFDGTVSSKKPVVRAVRLGEQNLAGSAISVIGAWQHGPLFRDIYRGRLVDYQLFGRPYQLSVQGSRNEIGGSWDVLLDRPFLTDLQRSSWRISAGSASGFLYFVRPSAPSAALRFTREYSDVGGVIAFGPVRHVFLLGATFSRERERTGHDPVIVSDTAVTPDTSSALVGRYSEHRTSRVNLLGGFRNLRFVRVHGFDAVEGAQDVRSGIQLSVLLGRGLKLTDADERDYFVSTDIYMGRATPASFAGIEVMGERRHDLDTHVTDGELASGRAAWYSHPAPKHTAILDAEFSGGWNQRVPFQVTLSDRDGGLLGYRDSDLGGAQRMVFRVEERYDFGHFRQFAAIAGALWVNAGKLWAGEAPFGVTTDVKYSVGIGLLAALPPRSRRTWRVDLAYPINDRGDAKFEIRVTNHDFTRWFWREPGDVQTSRERAIPNSVYNWP
ncbi:MAG: outer membrane protein assembly factor [Gemmatimonadota bacterium]|nr:outer membrane protein assembly factor [Gemmatimonadota bacterium]